MERALAAPHIMATLPPPPPPVEPLEPGPLPDEPSNRWPWIALWVGVLIIGVAVVFFLVSRQRAVNVTLAGSPTANPAVAGAASPGPPPTLVPPTLAASASVGP